METEYIAHVTLSNGKFDHVIFTADNDLSPDEISCVAHQVVMDKFGSFEKFTIEEHF